MPLLPKGGGGSRCARTTGNTYTPLASTGNTHQSTYTHTHTYTFHLVVKHAGHLHPLQQSSTHDLYPVVPSFFPTHRIFPSAFIYLTVNHLSSLPDTSHTSHTSHLSSSITHLLRPSLTRETYSARHILMKTPLNAARHSSI